jgi:hypothetical protein
MEAQLLNWALTIGIGLMAWLLKDKINGVNVDLQEHKDNHKILQNELNNVKINYVHKTDFQEFKAELWQRFDRLEDKLSK